MHSWKQIPRESAKQRNWTALGTNLNGHTNALHSSRPLYQALTYRQPLLSNKLCIYYSPHDLCLFIIVFHHYVNSFKFIFFIANE